MWFPERLLNKQVEIKWYDSAFERGWQYDKRRVKLSLITTIGFLAFIDSQVIEIASTIDEEDRAALNPLAIPRGSIINIRELR